LIFVAWGHFFTEDIPLFMWSGVNHIIGQNVGVSESLKSQQVFDLFQSIFSHSKSALSKYLTLERSPEVFVLFLEPKLRTDQISTYSNTFSPLKELLNTQSSSLTVPFIDAQISLNSVVISTANTAKQAGGKVFYFGKEGAILKELQKRDLTLLVSKLDDIQTTLNQHSDIYNNDKIDFIIVHLDESESESEAQLKFQNSVSVIENVQSIISSATSNYLAVYTALAYADAGLKGYGNNHHHGGQKRAISQSPQISPAPAPNNNTNTTPFFFEYFGGWFWEVLLLSFIAVPIVVSAIHAIDGIQTPDRFAKLKHK